MSFGGSAQAMNEAIKRNRRPRKKAFESWRKFERPYKGENESHATITPEQREVIRNKIKKERKKRLIRDLVMIPVAIIIFIALITVVVFLLNYHH